MRTIEKSDILQRANLLKDKLIEFRQHLHSHPELSFKESNTHDFIYKELSNLNCRIKKNIAGTGLTAEFGERGKTVIIRADMDALPISEENKKPYASTCPGVMHACGHDVHMSCALGAALLLSESPPSKGCVRILFQPAEEAVNEEGKGGAAKVIEAGATSGAAAAFALHVWPGLPTGKIGVREGALLAACESFEITIRGTGAHGARPEDGIDPVVLSAHVITAMQQVISRRKSALSPAILTVGGIKSSSYAPNVIPSEVSLTGTLRYFDPDLQEILHKELENACRIAEVLGGSFSINYSFDAPALKNNAELTEIVKRSTKKLLGEDALIEVPQAMGAEDFAFISDSMPSSFFLLGTEIEGSPRTLHSPTFDINENALPIGAAMLTEAALSYLDESKSN